MKTKDDIEYQDGMPLYAVDYDEFENPYFREYSPTRMTNRSVYAQTENGWWNIGGARNFYARKAMAKNEGLAMLQGRVDGLLEQIKWWRAL